MTERSVYAVWYKPVCTLVTIGSQTHQTFGLQCFGDSAGGWFPVERIEDVSTNHDSVLHLAEQFNHLQLSPLHFRDAVLDSVNV